VLDRILQELDISLTESEKNKLYLELSTQFDFIGSYRECERLEEMWADPLYRRAIEKYIKAWLNFRRRSVIEVYR
jgi:hypothetical protein